MALDNSTGKVFGNSGAADVEVHRTAGAVRFVERTLMGSEHVLSITDVWIPNKGFRASYIRNIANEFVSPPEILRSVFSGYARPF